MATRKKLKSDIVLVETDRITMHGLDLCQDILGKVNLGDMAFFQLEGRMPTPQESTVFNAITVTLVEHGMTPSAIVARMTYVGSPEAMQAAIAAGLCGMGSTMVGAMEDAARMLQEALPDPKRNIDIDALAGKVIKKYRAGNATIRGIGHHFHKPIDPRAPRLFEIARANGFDGPYVKLMQAIAKRAQTFVNAPGAIGAIRIAARGETVGQADSLHLRLRGLGPRQTLHVALMEDDGTTWTAEVPVDSTWSEPALPLSAFRSGRGVLLPQGFPGEWSYWVGAAAGRGDAGDRPRLERIERLQVSLRPPEGVKATAGGYGVEVEWIGLGFGRR